MNNNTYDVESYPCIHCGHVGELVYNTLTNDTYCQWCGKYQHNDSERGQIDSSLSMEQGDKMTKLTKELTLVEVDLIEKIAMEEADSEVAHEKEDDLRNWFICCVADGVYSKSEASEIANIVKSTSNIRFNRWCA